MEPNWKGAEVNPDTGETTKERVLAFLQMAYRDWGEECYCSVTQIAEALGVSRSSVRRAIQALGDRLDSFQIEPRMEDLGEYGPGRPPMVYAIKEASYGA